MRNFQLKKIAVALSLGVAVSAHAAGLGTMTSSSKLGEPLNAEIELLAVTPAELNSIQAVLASEQVYQDQMLEKPASYPFIKIEVANNSKGQPILKLSSSQPITEAFLDMLIQVDWPTGRLVKEYTLLLDPPGFNSNYVSDAAAPAVVSQNPASTSTPSATATQAIAATPEQKPAARSQPVTKKTPAPTEATEPAGAVTTEKGDTLYAIARQMKPDNVSTEQMLAALYQSNQQAFDGKNMNRLKVGKIIRLPDQATLEAMSRAQAKHFVAEHTTQWLAYKNALGKVVQEATPVATGGHTQQSAGKIGAAGEKTAPQAKAGKDVLKLSAGDEKSTAQADKATGKQASTAAQEDATAKANAIKEEQSRAAALEKQVADMKKLMEMKNSAMAQAEKNAAQTTPTAQPEVKGEPAPVAKPAEVAKVPPVPVVAEKPAEVTAPEKAAPPAPVVAEETAPVQQPSFMHVLLERLKKISPVLPVALIALPLLLCVWALIRIRRKKKIDNFEDVIVTSPATELQNNTVFGDTKAAASGDTSFLTDFSQSGVGGMIDSHDVDPIAEAEVYMAYGRDAQAEEILKDAIQKDPERQELKLKLLEIYQATNNKSAFETLAGDVYAKVGPTDAAWSKVVALGQKLDPENALYQVTSADAASNETVTEVTAPPEAADVASAESAAEDAYHFNFEAPALEFDTPETTAADEASSAAKETTPAFAETSDFVVESSALAETPDTVDTAPAEPTIELATAEDAFTLDASEAEPLTEAEEGLAFEPSISPAQQPAVATEVESVDEDALSLTPKALDLPSLNLEDGAAEADARLSLQTTTGEQSLANEDAVFESLPELSLELGGPNDAAHPLADEDDLEVEEISLGESVDALNAPVVTPASEAEMDFPEISLDMSEASAGSAEMPADEPEEVNTKLDLIQAYIDMEDLIGAKELIEEVLSEGGERQRQRATELLEKIA